MRKALWEQPAPVPVKKEAEPQPAEVVAERTRELLATRGWCLWKCSTLDGEIIAVARDGLVNGIPDGYPVYTGAELEELFWADVSEVTLRMIHEAKKLAGAKVTTEVTTKVAK